MRRAASQARVRGRWGWAGPARRASCLARTMSGSRASSGSGSSHRRAGRWGFLTRICFIGDLSSGVSIGGWEAPVSPAGRWRSSRQLVRFSARASQPPMTLRALSQRTLAVPSPGETYRPGQAERRRSSACRCRSPASQLARSCRFRRPRATTAGAAGRAPSWRPTGAAGCSARWEAARRCPRTAQRRCRAGSIPVRGERPPRGPPRDPPHPQADRGCDAGT